MFDLQPTLKGSLLELRPLRAEDFQDLYAVASDPLIWQQHPASDRHEEEVFKAFFAEAMASGGTLVAVDAKDGRIIGSSRFHGYDETKNEVEIGWSFLARSHWGGAHNREMKSHMLRHAFTFVDKVVFFVGPHNLRSQRAMEKIGGVPAGTRLNGAGQSRVVYEITKARWEGQGVVSFPAYVRRAGSRDLATVTQFFFDLWPDGEMSDHRVEAASILAGTPASTMPLVVFVAERGREVVGFIEVGLRSHADGCDTRTPVGFIEGWYVAPEHRRQGIGRLLVGAAEDWARAQGCRELASDTWVDHVQSQQAHESLGFEVVDRCVNYRRAIR